MKDNREQNLNPHAEARLAMALWADEYAAQRGGSIDFWDSLSPRQRGMCTRLVDDVLRALENGRRARS